MTRIPQCEVTNNDLTATQTTDPKTTTQTKQKAQTSAAASTSKRQLFGKDKDQWAATTFSDFNTLMFEPLVQMFYKAVADPSTTALLVNRMISIASGPSAYRLSAGAMRVLQEENAGGASEFSEAVSFEILHRLFDCELVKTEMSIGYCFGPWSRKTDLTVLLRGEVVAVSVTRAMRFAGTFTQQDAFNLLYKKLYGCQMSNRDVLACDRWTKQILHILCAHQYIVELLRAVYAFIYEHTPEVIGNTVVLITLTDNAPFLYFNFCKQQAEMQFDTTDAAAAVADAAVFTTPASVEESKSLRFAGAAGGEAKSDEFFFGYRTREEALVHDAIGVLQPVEADEADEEAYGLWDDEEELGAKGEAGGLLGAIAGLWEVDEAMGAFGTMKQAASDAAAAAAGAVEADKTNTAGARCDSDNNNAASTVKESWSVEDRIAALKSELSASLREARRRRAELDLISLLTAKISQLIAAGLHGTTSERYQDKPTPREIEQILSAKPAGDAAAAAPKAASAAAAASSSCDAMAGSPLHQHLLSSPPVPTSSYARRQHQLCARKFPSAGDLHPHLSLPQLQRLFAKACGNKGWIAKEMMKGGSSTSPTSVLTSCFQRYRAIHSLHPMPKALALSSADEDDDPTNDDMLSANLFDEHHEQVAQCA